MSGEIAQKSKSTAALLALERVAMVAAPTTRQGPHSLKLFAAHRTLRGFVHLFTMRLETDQLCVLVAADRALGGFPTTFTWSSVLVIPARRKKVRVSVKGTGPRSTSQLLARQYSESP